MGFRVKLDTNGTNPAMLRELLAENLLDFIAMDIKGPLDKYSAIAARPINLDAIRESIASLYGRFPMSFGRQSYGVN